MAKIFMGLAIAHLLTRDSNYTDGSGYGYGEDVDAKVSPFVFGLNRPAYLKKFEWIPNGGKDGAEQEALEIIFDINGAERSYRQFPVVKAFGKNREEITDPNSKEMKDARMEFNQRITHILHAFVEDAVIKQAFAKKINNFKEYCNIAKSLFPKNTPEIQLDIFMQYQWEIGANANRTFLDIPSKRKHGSFIVKSVPGTWTAIKVENPDDTNQQALRYGKEETAVVENGVKVYKDFHPFVRTGWFMNNNFAKQQRKQIEGDGNTDTSSSADAGAAMNAGTTDTTAASTTPSTW